jgi:hypothetical protein
MVKLIDSNGVMHSSIVLWRRIGCAHWAADLLSRTWSLGQQLLVEAGPFLVAARSLDALGGLQCSCPLTPSHLLSWDTGSWDGLN